MRYAIVIISTLLLVACGGSSSTSSGASGASSPAAAPASAEAGSIKVSLVDFKINPATLTAKAGDVSFAVSNDGKAPHSFALLDSAGKVMVKTADLAPGQSAVLKATLAAGMYNFDCTVPGHASLGMTGTLTVG